MQVNKDDWRLIHERGQESQLLDEWQYGIALTLYGYASGHWKKLPSAKQAKHAVNILKIAEDHGFFSKEDSEE